jgi:glycosyltransferase involved in cell wall biosynthesis
MQRVSAIVPAYNEAPRIGRVVETLVAFSGFAEIIVVDDGSTDGTAEVVKQFGVHVAQNEQNQGKGAALARGAKAAKNDTFFFCDADIIGLSEDIIAQTLAPVVRGENDLFIAARREKERRFGPFVFSPLLDGQRALTRELWDSVPTYFKHRFAIETALNHYAQRLGYQLHDITQARKEVKLGFVKGTLARYEMYRQIAWARAQLAFLP